MLYDIEIASKIGADIQSSIERHGSTMVYGLGNCLPSGVWSKLYILLVVQYNNNDLSASTFIPDVHNNNWISRFSILQAKVKFSTAIQDQFWQACCNAEDFCKKENSSLNFHNLFYTYFLHSRACRGKIYIIYISPCEKL